jgi:tetratricopeptide (TPR) repeat protein
MSAEQLAAVEEARAILDARRELYGESDPLTLLATAQLADALRDLGDFREAEALLRSSISIQNRAEIRDEARLTHTEFSLAIVLDRMGENDAARRLWGDVLGASDLQNGPESDLSLRAAVNLARSLRKAGRYGDEFPLRVRILESTKRAKGSEDVSTYQAMVDLAQTHRNLGNHDMALGAFTEALAGLERNGLDQRTLLYQKWAIASELVALKRTKEASKVFDEVVAGAIEHLDPDDPLRKRAVRQKRAYRLLGTFSRQRRPEG